MTTHHAKQSSLLQERMTRNRIFVAAT